MNNLPLQSRGIRRTRGVSPSNNSTQGRPMCGCGSCRNGLRHCSCIAEKYTCIERPSSGAIAFRADDDFSLPGSDWGLDPGPICFPDGFTILSEWTESCGFVPPIPPIGPIVMRRF